MKQYQGSIIQVLGDNIMDNIPFTTGKEAEQTFLQLCRKHIANFDEYTKETIKTILEEGYAEYERGFIAISWFI